MSFTASHLGYLRAPIVYKSMKYPVSPNEGKPGAQTEKVPTTDGDFTTAELVGIKHIDIAKMPAMVLATK